MVKRSNLIEEIENYQADEGYMPISEEARAFAIKLFSLTDELPRFYIGDDSVGHIVVGFPDRKDEAKNLRLCGTYLYWQHDDLSLFANKNCKRNRTANYGAVHNLTPQKIKNAILWLSK
jgi:hypothetical protein